LLLMARSQPRVGSPSAFSFLTSNH
jgi:hypothetical protein